MNVVADTNDLPCRRKACTTAGRPDVVSEERQTPCSPVTSDKTLKDILKENFCAKVLEKAVILIFGGFIVAIMHFWLGLIR